jgi:hypothetical protein
MKRSVAILGPTPMFLRWAILQPCHLREIHAKRLPETTFRQLRAIRETSLAKIENRVFENIGVHPQASEEDASSALGFSLHEILEMHGGEAAVQHCCQPCPANVAAIEHPGLLAGCYGWLPVDPSLDLDSITRGSLKSAARQETVADVAPLIQWVENASQPPAIQRELAELFPVGLQTWSRLFQGSSFTRLQLLTIEKIFLSVLHELKSANPRPAPPSLTTFVHAISTCRNRGLSFHFELVPAGYSDGLTWTISRHCGVCKFQANSETKTCPGCGQTGQQQSEIKLKVLGIRPYLQLSAIFGNEATRKFLTRYAAQRPEILPDTALPDTALPNAPPKNQNHGLH